MFALAATLALAGCAGAPVIQAAPSACSTLLPAEWLKGVAAVDLPGGETVGDWIVAFDAQTGQLEKSNDRYAAALGIVGRCEDRDRAALKAARPKVLGIF